VNETEYGIEVWYNEMVEQDKVTFGGNDRRMRENDGGGEKDGFER
jgi:hypothetical protein